MNTYFLLYDGFVKIGRAKDVEKRINGMLVAMPKNPVLLKVSDKPEKACHIQAQKLSKRINGEWFVSTNALLRWIKSLDCSDKTRRYPRAYNKRLVRPTVDGIKQQICITKWVLCAAEKEAAKKGMDLSQWISNLIQEKTT
jgi:hypothetical protein